MILCYREPSMLLWKGQEVTAATETAAAAV